MERRRIASCNAIQMQVHPLPIFRSASPLSAQNHMKFELVAPVGVAVSTPSLSFLFLSFFIYTILHCNTITILGCCCRSLTFGKIHGAQI